jgi:uncharacterized Zn finger protein
MGSDSVSKDSLSNNSLRKDSIDRLCDDCGETFSEFLHEMAEQNAKVATCPKCGKIHQFAKAKELTKEATKEVKTVSRRRPVKKAI